MSYHKLLTAKALAEIAFPRSEFPKEFPEDSVEFWNKFSEDVQQLLKKKLEAAKQDEQTDDYCGIPQESP